MLVSEGAGVVHWIFCRRSKVIIEDCYAGSASHSKAGAAGVAQTYVETLGSFRVQIVDDENRELLAGFRRREIECTGGKHIVGSLCGCAVAGGVLD